MTILGTMCTVDQNLSSSGPLTFAARHRHQKNFFVFQKYSPMMEAGNTDDLLDYLKLDADHHEKIASLIPQVGFLYIANGWYQNEAWQCFFGNHVSFAMFCWQPCFFGNVSLAT